MRCIEAFIGENCSLSQLKGIIERGRYGGEGRRIGEHCIKHFRLIYKDIIRSESTCKITLKKNVLVKNGNKR